MLKRNNVHHALPFIVLSFSISVTTRSHSVALCCPTHLRGCSIVEPPFNEVA